MPWRVKFLKDVIKFRISLFRERFSIFGWTNLLAFWSLFIFLFVGSKFVFIILGHYDTLSLLIGGLIYCFVFRFVFPKNTDKECQNIKIFFPKINVNKYLKYILYYKFFIYEFVLLYNLFPCHLEDTPFFLLVIAFIHALMLLTVYIRSHYNINFFNQFLNALSVLLCIVLFLYNKGFFTIPDMLLENAYFIIFYAVIYLISVSVILKMLNYEKDYQRTVCFVKITGKINCINKNKDILFLLRTNKFIEPFAVVLISAIISNIMHESPIDMFITNLFSFSFAFIYIYMELLKFEDKTFLLLYDFEKNKSFKMEKIIHATESILLVFIILFIPLGLLTSFLTVIFSLIVSAVLFFVNANIFKINIEKGKGYKKIVTDKENLWFTLLFALEIMAVYLLVIYIL